MAAILQHVPRFIDAELETATFTGVDEPRRFRGSRGFVTQSGAASTASPRTDRSSSAEFSAGGSWFKVGTMAGDVLRRYDCRDS